MGYTVIKDFSERFDNWRKYEVGAEYPQGDFEPTEERFKELETGNNQNGQKFIERKEDTTKQNKSKKTEDKTKDTTKHDDGKEHTAETETKEEK